MSLPCGRETLSTNLLGTECFDRSMTAEEHADWDEADDRRWNKTIHGGGGQNEGKAEGEEQRLQSGKT